MIQNLFWFLTRHALDVQLALAERLPPQPVDPPDPEPANPNKIQFFNPLDDVTITELLQKILTGLTALAIPVVTVIIVIGAYYIITSGGNPGRRTKGKDYILWAAIGFAILLLADSVVFILSDFLGLNI